MIVSGKKAARENLREIGTHMQIQGSRHIFVDIRYRGVFVDKKHRAPLFTREEFSHY